jgi:hypothetical protein
MGYFYVIYKIINKINKKFYIGVHKTKDIHDDYYGSGSNIQKAIKKYSIENFEKIILHVFAKSKDAFLKEKELVTEDLIKNPMCYNLKIGGSGGFDFIKKQNKHTSCLGKKIIHNKQSKKMTKVDLIDLQKFLDNGWELGFSPESLQKMSESGRKKIQSEDQRKKNSETKKNSCIIENLKTKERKFIKKTLVNDYLNNGWIIFDRGEANRGKRTIINPETKECVRVNLKEVDIFLKKGWKMGRKI